MKKPKLNNLKQDTDETRNIHAVKHHNKSIKITINIDSDSLQQLREMAGQTGIPYQRLLNRYLQSGLEQNISMESRLKRIEKEIERLKKGLAA